ncbi:MAG TPA: TolC family protein [Terriglobia bacterium]|nr:TolC family protein [Terriglobia bacterium]
MTGNKIRQSPPKLGGVAARIKDSQNCAQTGRSVQSREATLYRIFFALLLALALATTSFAQTDWVGQFLNRYKPLNPAITPQAADEPWRLMVRQDTLPVSVPDIIRLMLASNLDVSVNRLTPLTKEYLLNTLFLPFQPTLNVSARAIRSTTPSASQLIGASSLSQLIHQYGINYSQTLQTGTQVNVGFTMNRNSSNSLFNTFNPYYSGNITYSFAQPVLQNFGRDINRHLIRIAQNNRKMSDIDFEMQTIDLVTAAQQMYWDLFYQREDIKIHRQALELAQKTLADNKRQVQIGTMARIEVVQAESEVAQREVQMVTSSYTADQTQDRVKKLITSLGDPALVSVDLTPIETPHKPADDDILSVGDAIKSALESRPEMRQLALQLQNGDIDVQYTKNQLLPNLTVGASYTQSGVGGTQTLRSGLGGSDITSVINGGLGDAFGQLFGYNFTGYSVGFNLAIPLSNKAAQADNARAVTQRESIQARRTQMAQQIALEVRNAQSVVVMNRTRINAAEKALELANLQLEAEQKKFQLGISQLRFVLEEQRNVTDAETTYTLALVSYAKSLVDYDHAVGRTLRKNNVEIDKLASGGSDGCCTSAISRAQ